MSDLTLVVVGKDQADLLAFERLHVQAADLVLVANTERTSLARIGNHYLEHARTRIVGLCHADAVFGPGALWTFSRCASVGVVCGIVGITLQPEYRWCSINPGNVSTLDACAVFLPRDLGLRFDADTFNSLHCHVEDLCLQAQRLGIPVVVPAAEATHVSQTRNGAAWLNEYWTYRAKLSAKWPGVEFRTT